MLLVLDDLRIVVVATGAMYCSGSATSATGEISEGRAVFFGLPLKCVILELKHTDFIRFGFLKPGAALLWLIVDFPLRCGSFRHRISRWLSFGFQLHNALQAISKIITYNYNILLF